MAVVVRKDVQGELSRGMTGRGEMDECGPVPVFILSSEHSQIPIDVMRDEFNMMERRKKKRPQGVCME